MKSENKKGKKILNEDNIIFEIEDEKTGIESIFSFKDGDLLVFKNNICSILYDGKTFSQKLELNFLGALCSFCYLNEEEFIVIKDFYFSLYKFENNRTNCKIIATINKNEYQEINKKIFCLSNNDLLSISELDFKPIIKIFRRTFENNQFKDYQLLDNYKLDEIGDVINLEDDQFLTIKKNKNADNIMLKVYSNKNYIILRNNRIQCIVNNKRRIAFFSDLPFIKVNNNKILFGNANFLYIFGTDTLELETTIKISPDIMGIRMFRDNSIILFECSKELIGLKNIIKYYITKVWIDFESNEFIKKESEEITEEIGEYKTLFNICNYLDNGLATIIEQYKLKIYKNMSD